MHARRWTVFICTAVSLVAGCGGASAGSGSPFTDPPTAGAVPVSGNWAFKPALSGTPTTPAVLPPFVAGSVIVSGTQISADVLTLLIVTGACPITSPPDVTLAGTVQKSQISLTSAAWNGSLFTVTGSVSADGQSITASWSAKGGCVDGQSGSFLGSYVPSITGTWTGTASNLPNTLSSMTTPSPLNDASLTFQLQQSSTSAGYAFPLSGTVTVSGTSCGFTHGTLMQSPIATSLAPSSVSGETWTVLAQMDDGKSVLVGAGAPLPTNSGQWLTVVGITGGACDSSFAEATLMKQ